MSGHPTPSAKESKYTTMSPQRPQTPPSVFIENSMILNATPVLTEESTSQMFSSTHLVRDERITAMYKEISGRVVGPMKVMDFLDQYLPQTPTGCPKITAEMQKKYKAFSESSSEFAMYQPWVHLISQFCPNLDLMDVHNTPALDFDGKQVKPDIQIYSITCKRSRLSDMTQTEMSIEFKKAVGDDAFNDDSVFEHNSSHAHDTLGQITLYATAHQAAQFRTHVFLVLVFPKYARFTRWDRSGIIVTERVPFTNPSYVAFFWRFNHASPSARGVDTTVTAFPNDHPKMAMVKRSLNLVDGDRLFQVQVVPHSHSYIFCCPPYMAVGSPLGHSTRVFAAYCLETEQLVLLKDTWRVISPTQSPEHIIYEQLKKHNVRNVCTSKEGRNVLDQLTKTQDSSMARQLSQQLRRFRHYQLVLNEIRKSLSNFTRTSEMVTAIRDAIIAHGDAYDKAKILHGDISSGNILITKGGRLLIDWDLCKELRHIHQEQAHTKRTGTWQFMAARLQVVPNEEQPVIRDRVDNLESFFYVLVWIALRYTEHSFFKNALVNILKNALVDILHDAFDYHYLGPQGAATGGHRKRLEIQADDPFEVSRLDNVPLQELIKTLAKTLAVRYKNPPNETQITKCNEILQQEAAIIQVIMAKQQIQEEELFQVLLIKQYVNWQDTLEHHDWMASEFTTALQKSGWCEHGGHVKRDLLAPPPTQRMITKTEYSEDAADPTSEELFGK